MLSVITVCYNSEKTIGKAVESLLHQTNRNFEHIVIDGQSKDNTLDVIQGYKAEYEDKGIRLILVSEKDSGIYDAMNKGIMKSSGELIGILNSDDWYCPNTVEIIEQTSQKYPDADIIMGASETINGQSRTIRKVRLGRFLTSRDFNHGAMFVKKDCYMDIGTYDTSGNIYADFKWYIRARKRQKAFKIIDDNLYIFNCGGISTKKTILSAVNRVKDRYDCYKSNGCSGFYMVECVLMETAKLLLVKG